MSLSKCTMLFVLVFTCYLIIVTQKVEKFSEATQIRVELNDTVDRALDAAADDIMLSTNDYTASVSRKKCSDNFYRALYAGFNVLDGSEEQQRLIDLYVPVFAMVDTDGITVQHCEMVNGEFTKVWGQKRIYSKTYDQEVGAVANQYLSYSVIYTLDSTITVLVDDKQYTGKWSDLKKLYAESTKDEDKDISLVMGSKIFESDNSFRLERGSAVTDNIIDVFEYYVNRHNDIARQFGISYTFTVPSSARSDLARSIESTSFICLFQGYPLGQGTSEEYSTFALAGTRIAKNQQYVVTKDESGVLHYHKMGCSETKNATRIYNSKRKCALQGALPCERCRP